MGRQSLTGVAPTRTVDEELAENNMTRQDISVGPYRFTRVWARLRSQGWHARNGPPLGYDHYYIKPGKDIDGVQGEDYLYGEAAVSFYGIRMKMFEEEDGEPSPRLKPRSASATTPPSAGKSPRLSVDSPGSSVGAGMNPSPAASAATGQRGGVNGSAATHDGETRRVSEGAVKTVKTVGKPRGKARQKSKRAAAVPARQWPESHPRKGRHEADAICLLDSDDDDEELEEKAPAVTVEPKVEDVKDDGDDEEVKRPASGKRKALFVETEEEEEEDHDGGDAGSSIANGDSAMDIGGQSGESEDFDSAGSSSRQKRPKLTTRVTKKQKQSLHSTASTANGRNQYGRTSLKAGKVKSAPRGLMFHAHSSFKTHAQDESPPPVLKNASKKPRARESKPAAERRPPVQQKPPPQAVRKPRVVQGLASQFEGAAVKAEPQQESSVTPTSPPSRPASRTSSVASSHRSYAAPTMASSPTQSTTGSSRPIVRLDVKGVTFKSFPGEKYHVVITEDPGSSETTIVMEERTTKVQMQLAYFDISTFSKPPKNPHATPQPPALVYQALSLLLKRVSETIAVDDPPYGVTSEDDGSPFGDFDLVREDSANVIVMEFPNLALLAQVHRFPMVMVAESPRVQALSAELNHAKQEFEAAQQLIEAYNQQNEKQRHELEAAQRDVEAFKKQHKQLEKNLKASQGDLEASEKQKQVLERENQKLRKAADQQQRRSSNGATIPPPQPAPAAPRSPVETVPVVVPVASPSPRGKDISVTFHGQSSWLGTAHPNATAIAAITWTLKWERIVEASVNHYELVADNATSTMVKLLKRGSYQLNLNVIHQTNRQLVITVTSTQSRSHQLKPSTVQVIETKNKTMHRSRIDQIIECDVDDTVAVQLQSRNETDPLHGGVMMVKSLTAQPNKWLMQFIDGQFLLAGGSNGVAASQ